MLKKISLVNFKSFKELNELELKNLTVIVGKNSCGKSSILQSLLLLKQTLESSSNTPLCLEGKYLKFSGLEEVAFGLPTPSKANIGYTLSFNSELEHLKEDDDIVLRISFKNKKINNNYSVEVADYDISDDNLRIARNDLSNSKIKLLLKDKHSNEFDKINNEGINYKVHYQKFIPEYIEVNFKKDEEENSRSSWFPIGALYEHNNRINFWQINYELHQSIKGIRYLSPVRAIPERAYVHYSRDSSELNEDGSNSAHVLSSKQHKKFLWKGELLPLKDAVNLCTNCMGLSQKITPNRTGDILYKVGIEETTSKRNVSLADVGFGYSQILPVILMGLTNDKNNLMLLEQPEIHLHPSSAANLADLFLGFVEDDKRFIIETHSPELINRLRLRVIENPSLKEKINIVFVDFDHNSGATIKQFSIDENGMFPEWPDGFLDESEKLARAILEARLKKS